MAGASLPGTNSPANPENHEVACGLLGPAGPSTSLVGWPRRRPRGSAHRHLRMCRITLPDSLPGLKPLTRIRPFSNVLHGPCRLDSDSTVATSVVLGAGPHQSRGVGCHIAEPPVADVLGWRRRWRFLSASGLRRLAGEADDARLQAVSAWAPVTASQQVGAAIAWMGCRSRSVRSRTKAPCCT
jgi:hypothetical protein